MKAGNGTSPPSKKASRAALLLAAALSLLLVGCGVAAEAEMPGGEGADGGEDREASNIVVIPTTWPPGTSARRRLRRCPTSGRT